MPHEEGKCVIVPKPLSGVENTYQHILATRSTLHADVNLTLFQNTHITGPLVLDGLLLGILRHDTILLIMCTTSKVASFPLCNFLGGIF